MMLNGKYTKILTVGVSVLTLTACSAPGSMPTGYTHHHETYKSPTPPPSSKVTLEQRQYMDAAQAEQFRDAVYDLLTRLTQRAGMPPKPVYIVAPDPMTTFYANIDNDLRESMRSIGYALSDTPTGAYVFAYDAMVIEKPRDHIAVPGEPNVELVLKVFSDAGADARMLSEESDRYYIQGAEALKIQPALYDGMIPHRQKIMQQATGFNDRTAGQTPRMRSTTSFGIPSPVSAPSVAIPHQPSFIPPAPHVPVLPPTANYSGPSNAVSIRSGGSVSYAAPERPMVNTQRLSSDASGRVSKAVEY